MMRSVVMLLVCAAVHAGAQQTIFVDGTKVPRGDGQSWATAYRDLTDALGAAGAGDTLWIAASVYTPRTPSGRGATFDVPPGVTLLGGFRGNEVDVRQRNPASNRTVLDGGGTSYTVVTITGIAPGTEPVVVIDGFLITNAVADGPTVGPEQRGAGIYCENNDLVVERCIFRDLTAEQGSGINLRRSGGLAELTVSDSSFDSQSGSGCIGGAPSRLVVERCTFTGNDAGAIDIGTSVSGTEILDCVIEDNTTIWPMIELGFSDSLIDGCTIRNNETRSAGAVRYFGRDNIIRNSVIVNNTAPFAISSNIVVNNVDSLLVENTLFLGNFSQGPGGVIQANDDSAVELVNVTMVGNSVNQDYGAAIYAREDAQVTVRNSIMHGNTADGSGPDERVEVLAEDNASVQVFRTIVEDLGLGPAPAVLAVGGLLADPMLADPDGLDNMFGTADDNPRPSPGSPAIDAGDNAALSAGITNDTLGSLRFRDDPDTADTGLNSGQLGVVDLGAVEYNPCPADANNDGFVSPTDFNAWVIAFNMKSAGCDQNGDGVCTPQDFNAWILNYNTGC